MKSAETKNALSSILVAVGLAAMLSSIVLYMFFWRVDNEPGAKDVPALLWAAISFCSLGGLVFLGSQVYLIVNRAWLMLGISWALCIGLIVVAISLAPILLLFMV